MATEKILNTRIALKIDSLENWNKSTLGLKKGELAIATVAATAGTGLTEPVCMIKIGEDGVKTFSQLEWNFYAKASDVLSACKSEDALKAFVNGVIADAGIASSDAMEQLAGRVTTVEGEITTLKGDESTAGSIAKAIKDAIDALDLANTYATKEHEHTKDDITDFAHTHEISEVNGLQDALDSKQAVGDYATKSEAQGYANAKDDAIAEAKKAGDDAQADVDALAEKVGTVADGKTVVQMIEDAKTAATYDDTQVKADIEANAEAIALLNDGSTVEGSVDYKIAQAVAAIMENPDDTMNSINELVTWCNDHAADALELSNKVSANETDIAALEKLVGSTAVATQITDAIASALKIDGVDKYALAADLTAAIARIAALEKDTHTHSNKALLDTYDQTNANIKSAVDKAHEHSNKATLDKVTEDKLTAWDKVSEKANDADLAAIAKTGNVNDLIQTDGDYIIFNCGSATEVI